MGEKIKVAGKVEINLSDTNVTGANRSTIVLNEFRCYLQCFLETCVFPDNPQRVLKVIRTLLQTANLKRNILSFNFPYEIRDQFCLRNSYHMQLCHKDVFEFYKELRNHHKFMCHISIDALGKKKKYALRRIQKIVWKSHTHIDGISITRYNSSYIVVINFRLQECPRIEIKSDDMIQAIYDLQKVLLPKNEQNKRADLK